jgi:anti-sigma factor RsiW
MNCEKATELWSSYCEKEIDAESREELEKHLATCRVCAEGLAAFQKTLESLKDLPALTPSPSFDARLARALAEESLQDREPWYGKFGGWCVRFAPAAASVAAVLAISFYLALQVAPVREAGPESQMRPDVTASEPVSSDQYAASLPGRASVRVEPWSVAGQWSQAPADSVMSGYRVRFVLDKVILEGEEAARSSVPQDSEGVQMKYVTF